MMITNIWLKSQPNKKISYPDCYPELFLPRPNVHMDRVILTDVKDNTHGEYKLDSITRIEFRP